jgi:hypothetical protein
MMMNIVIANEKHKKFRKALEGAIAEGAMQMEAEEILAVTCNFVGQLVALQDQRKFTSAMVMEIVHQNILQGNQDVANNLLLAKPQGNA